MEEEVNRMREHVFKEVDKDKDGLISRQEFLDMTRTQEFEQDNGWKGLDEQQIYTQEELQRFMQMREQQMQMAMVSLQEPVVLYCAWSCHISSVAILITL